MFSPLKVNHFENRIVNWLTLLYFSSDLKSGQKTERKDRFLLYRPPFKIQTSNVKHTRISHVKHTRGFLVVFQKRHSTTIKCRSSEGF